MMISQKPTPDAVAARLTALGERMSIRWGEGQSRNDGEWTLMVVFESDKSGSAGRLIVHTGMPPLGALRRVNWQLLDAANRQIAGGPMPRHGVISLSPEWLDRKSSCRVAFFPRLVETAKSTFALRELSHSALAAASDPKSREETLGSWTVTIRPSDRGWKCIVELPSERAPYAAAIYVVRDETIGTTINEGIVCLRLSFDRATRIGEINIPAYLAETAFANPRLELEAIDRESQAWDKVKIERLDELIGTLEDSEHRDRLIELRNALLSPSSE